MHTNEVKVVLLDGPMMKHTNRFKCAAIAEVVTKAAKLSSAAAGAENSLAPLAASSAAAEAEPAPSAADSPTSSEEVPGMGPSRGEGKAAVWR
jgi:hypothetical protein